jgi:hypothetical protein
MLKELCATYLVLNTVLDAARSKPNLVLENMLLRQQLIVLKRQARQPALTWHDGALFVLLASRLPTWKEALVIVQPEIVLRWHRDLFRWVWRRKECFNHARPHQGIGQRISCQPVGGAKPSDSGQVISRLVLLNG